ncbi:glycosyl transferase family 2 [Actibacterium mucosum KCTC 23349]|uniref:Glycosyl transferase family 2 n=1 Tax=Actibacterium mucosum KCTC 23349 TaxID=1454373 RepID=A0A037ZL03_9RHOB|nr:glycosyltransferase family 2 protein [Actibacterium mucosum]KAJ55496.1 glycosyl transferase family 2 [Actibacterium mucosum KCTC 23349]
MRVTAVTCVKNEGPFLLEWIAFNRMIGVTDHLFYSNDCTDGTDLMLDALARHGIVTHLPNPAEGRNYQMEALRDARQQAVVTNADWLWIADVDEFLNIHAGNGTLPDLIRACGEPSAISVTFQFFANAGIDGFVDKPVIEQFTRSHNPDIWTDQTAQEVKSLFRTDLLIKYIGAHRPFLRPKALKRPYPVWTDGSGRLVPEEFLLGEEKNRLRKFPARGARSLATLNHYALRSLDSYLVKNDRGDVNREHRHFDDSYWRERNDDAHEDLTIRRHLPKLKKEIAALKKLDGIKAQHAACVKAHKAKIEELNALPSFADMRAKLRAAPVTPPQEDAMIAMLTDG